MPYCDNCCDHIDTDFDDYHYCDDCDTYTCDGCDHEPDYYSGSPYGSNGGVNSWDYKPDYLPKGMPGAPMFGVELEVGGRQRDIITAVHRTDDCESHLYMKEDGSISGVEIVTHPMTLAYAHEYPFRRLLADLRNNGAYSDDGYGLHVHVSRASFDAGKASRSAAHQMAWLLFLYRNSEHLQALARRHESRWASFRRPNRGELKAKATMPGSGSDRYVAVNCLNQHTFELRFFQSTVDVVEFYAAIEFAAASVEYTRSVKAADILRGDGLRWSNFVEWISARGDVYGNLLSEIAVRVSLPDSPNIIPNGVVMPDPVPWCVVTGDRRYTLWTRDEAADRAGIGGIIVRYESLMVVGPVGGDGAHELANIGGVYDDEQRLIDRYNYAHNRAETMFGDGSQYVSDDWRIYATAR